MLRKLPKLNSSKMKKTQANEFDFDLPEDFVVSKFYEYGHKVTHNKFSNTYQSCCPLCHEGKSWGKKKRCFYIPENKNIFCHNCGESLTPYSWIRKASGMTHQEIVDCLKSDEYGILTDVGLEKETKREIDTLPKDSINLLDPIQVEYFKDNEVVAKALAYIKQRRLDRAVNAPDSLYLSLNDKFQSHRLVIPFKDENGKIIFYQTRKLFMYDEKPDYLSKPDSDKSLAGIENVDPDMDCVFLFEGPIDSYFVKNGIGVAGINKGNFLFTETQKQQLKSLSMFEKIWVLDSQWIDKTAREKTLSLLEAGEKVFIWPKKWGEKYKDLNALCVGVGIDHVSPAFIKKNSTQGMSAVMKFKMLFSGLD